MISGFNYYDHAIKNLLPNSIVDLEALPPFLPSTAWSYIWAWRSYRWPTLC